MADVKPGEFPAIPTTRDDLLIESLRFANRVSGLLNELSSAIGELIESEDDHRFDSLDELLRRRFSDYSGVYLFIAADNLRLELPGDLRGDPLEDLED